MNDMRPTETDTTIKLPVTFDYHGGRADENKSLILSTIIVCVVSIFIMVSVIKSDKVFWVKLLVVFVVLLLSSTFLRFKTFREQTYSDALETLIELDYTPPTSSFWGIYEVDSTMPHIARFKSGLKGIFIRLEKDVVVGKPETVEYDHYEALSDAYNMASSMSMNMVHIDYMDNVGNDSRLDSLYEGLNDSSNEDLKSLMLQVYSNLQFEMSKDYASYDVYLFTSKAEDENLWYSTREIIERLMCGNYVSYNILDLEEIRKVAVSLYNLEDFSAVEACNNAFAGSKYRGIVPIKLYKEDGASIKLNDTLEEKRIKQQERLEKDRLLKEQKKEKSLVSRVRRGSEKAMNGNVTNKKRVAKIAKSSGKDDVPNNDEEIKDLF